MNGYDETTSEFGWEDDGAAGDDLPEIIVRDLDDLPEDVQKRIEVEGTIGPDSVDLVKGVRPMFGSPGGKRFLAKTIVGMFPKHETYVEAFIGGGAVFYAKAKDASTKEIIGDGDPEIAAAYKFLQGATDDQIARLRKMPMKVDRATHKALRTQKAVPTDPVARFHKFWYMTRCSMFGRRNGGSFNVGNEGKDLSPAIDRIPIVKDRLAGVTIKSGDFRKTVAAGDGPNTLIYLDPPYEGTIWDGPMLSTDEFLAAVRKMKGMVIASHIGHPEVVKKFKDAGLRVQIVEVRRGVGNVRASQGGETRTQMAKELIATNYDKTGKRCVKDEGPEESGAGPRLDAGAHQHDLDPAAGQTLGDGAHMHAFALLDGVMLFTAEDGSHVHPVPAQADAMDKAGGPHKHTITLPSGETVETADGGAHLHDLLGMTTAIDGVHVHDLTLPTGDKITSLSPSGHRRIETGEAPAASPGQGDPEMEDRAKKGIPIDFKEGDEGEGVLQTHERGLREETIKRLPGIVFGFDPIEVGPESIARLGKVVVADWTGPIEKIAKGGADSDTFAALGDRVAEALAKDGLSDADRRALCLIDPVAVHTDLRLRKTLPYPVNYWEGGEIQTPTHQFRENGIPGMAVRPETTIPMRFQIAKGQQVARGSLDWMRVGTDTPAVFPPGEVGDAAGYTRFLTVEKFAWKAGVQTPIRKEFWFDGSILQGRYLIEKTASGIAISRPADQKMESSIFEANGQIKKTLVPICKVEEEKRIAVGPVLIPDVVDAQGDKISAEAIEAAAHEFLERLNKATQAGVMHRFFDKDVRVVESFIAPQDLDYGDRRITKGTWVMAVHVIDDGTWDRIRSKEIKGYSIGGVAQAVRNVTGSAE